MKCINCGVNLQEGATYCVRCGSFQNPSQMGIDTTVNTNNEAYKETSKNVDYDILVQAYVGKKYNKFKYSNFSWLYFFFGPFYGFCRRMYGFSLLNFFALFLTGFASLIGVWFELICVLIINLFFCFKFKSSYLEIAEKRVDKIVRNNPNLDMVMLQEKCRKKGGINVFWVIMTVLLPVVIFVSIFVLAFSSTSILINNTQKRIVESGAKMHWESLSNCVSMESYLNNTDEVIKKCDESGIKEYLSDREYNAEFSFELDKDINTNKIIVKSFEYTQSGYTIKLVDSYKKVDKNVGQFVSGKRDIDSVQLALNNVVWQK